MTLLPTDKQARKDTPICRGVLDYFPLALAEIARVSKAGNDQHNPGQPLHWAKEKSTDHADCIARHLIERGTMDDDGMRHSAKMAWRALALLQIELEQEASICRAAQAEASGQPTMKPHGAKPQVLTNEAYDQGMRSTMDGHIQRLISSWERPETSGGSNVP